MLRATCGTKNTLVWSVNHVCVAEGCGSVTVPFLPWSTKDTKLL